MELDKINDKVQKIQEDLRKVKETVFSEAKRKEKIEEIKRRAEKTKKELEKNISTLKDKTKEEAKILLNSLNEIINFKLSIGDNASGNIDSHTLSSDGKKSQGFFEKSGNRIGEQRDKVWDGEKRSTEGGKNLLRTVGFAVSGVGAVALAYKGVKKLWNWAFSDDEDENDKVEKSGETKSNEEKKGFWDSWFGKTLKWLGIGAGAVGGGYLLGKYSNGGKNNPEISIDEEMENIYGFENECKGLKEGGERCLNLSHTYVVDHLKNKKEYDSLLERALVIKDESEIIFGKIESSNAGDKTKKQAERIKNNIDHYIDEIESMKEDIYKNVPEGSESGDDNEEKDKDFEPVDTNVVTEAIIDYFDKNVKKISLDNEIKDKLKKNLNKYLVSYPILKKDKDNNMKFEIENKSEFSEMIKQSWNDILDGLPRYKSNSLRVALKAFTKNGFDDIDETIKELDVKYYENVIFKYFGGIVKNVVKHEKGKLKVQDFYDSISNIYPNKDSGIVASHLASSGESNKDIKNMKYPFA